MPAKTVMMYGLSGSTKTTQCYQLVKWLLAKPENKGKHFRMIHSDPGGYDPFVQSGMVQRGEVKVVEFSNRLHALANWRWLSEGFWPLINVKLKDNTVLAEYFRKDANCRKEGWEKDCLGYIVEGYTSAAEVLKNHISNQREGVGFKESWAYDEEGESFTGLQQGHYGLIQKEVADTHRKGFKNLPVEWLICTALLGSGVDKKKEDVYAPALVGDALNSTVPSWFNHCLHLDEVTNAEGQTGKVAWFVHHHNNDGWKYLCKCSCLPDKIPQLYGKFKQGYVPLGFNRGIDIYFEEIEKFSKS